MKTIQITISSGGEMLRLCDDGSIWFQHFYDKQIDNKDRYKENTEWEKGWLWKRLEPVNTKYTKTQELPF
jgi:uncharacterized iron-regulated protein